MRWNGILPLVFGSVVGSVVGSAVLSVVACSPPKPVARPAPPVATSAPGPTPAAAPAPKALPRLFSEAEIRAYEAELLARLDANAKRSCPGPNGSVPGPSAPELAALFEGSGTLGACVQRLDAAGGHGKLKSDLEAKTPEVLALDKDCGETLAAAVRHAAAFQDGCSAYQLGVRAEPRSLMAPIQIAHLIGFHASLDKDPVTAIALLVAALRLMQDLERGHVTLISAMISVAASEIIGGRLDAILDTAKLPKSRLDALAGQLDQLIAAVPSFHEVLAGEREAQELYFGIAKLKGPDWTPPGGWTEELRQMTAERKGENHVADPRDEAAALVASSIQSAEARDKACPANATLDACMQGLVQLAAVPMPPQVDTAQLWQQGKTDEPGMRAKLRQQIIDVLAAIASPSYAQYVAKVAGQVARLGELRMHVETLRTHACDRAVLLALSPAALGVPMLLTVDKKTVEVKGGPKLEWKFACR